MTATTPRRSVVSGFEFVLIPEAGHLYWAPGSVQYNETAAELAAGRLKEFLAKYL